MTGCGRRQVDPLCIETGFEGAALELRVAGVPRGFDRLLDGVQELADARALFGRELAELLRDLRQRALAAEHFDADLLELFGGGGGGDALPRARLQFVQHGFEWHVRFRHGGWELFSLAHRSLAVAAR